MRFWMTYIIASVCPMRHLGNLFNPGEKKKSSQTQDLTWAYLFPFLMLPQGQTLCFSSGKIRCLLFQRLPWQSVFPCYRPFLPRHYSTNTCSRPAIAGISDRRKRTWAAEKSSERASPASQSEPSCFQAPHCEVGASGACLWTSRARPWRILTSPTISYPPPPTPLATELRLSHKSNRKK